MTDNVDNNTSEQNNTDAEVDDQAQGVLKKEDAVADKTVEDEGILDEEDGALLDDSDVLEDPYTDFTFGEGAEVNSDILGKFSSLAKGVNLSQEDAQKFIDLSGDISAAFVESQQKQWKDIKSGWLKSLKDDPDMGKGRFKETKERANRSLRKFGSKELISLFKESGYGNNPEIVRLLVNMDKHIGEDTFVENGSDTVEKKDLSYTEKMYPDLVKKNKLE